MSTYVQVVCSQIEREEYRKTRHQEKQFERAVKKHNCIRFIEQLEICFEQFPELLLQLQENVIANWKARDYNKTVPQARIQVEEYLKVHSSPEALEKWREFTSEQH